MFAWLVYLSDLKKSQLFFLGRGRGGWDVAIFTRPCEFSNIQGGLQVPSFSGREKSGRSVAIGSVSA